MEVYVDCRLPKRILEDVLNMKLKTITEHQDKENLSYPSFMVERDKKDVGYISKILLEYQISITQ